MKTHKRKTLPKVLVTAFEPFAGASVNPSQQIVEALPATINSGSRLVKVKTDVLPTVGDAAWKQLKKTVSKQKEPFILVCLGLAEGRSSISVERFALNIRDYRIADNAGQIRQDESIDRAFPDALRTRLPVEKLATHLADAGFPCEVSNHAGTFICNETYFHALKKWNEDKRCKGVLFVHVPSPEAYARLVQERLGTGTVWEGGANSVEALSHLTAAITELIRLVSKKKNRRK